MRSTGTHRILFLHSELAGYVRACFNELSQHQTVQAVQVIHWPVSPEAPFNFKSKSDVKFTEKLGGGSRWLKAEVACFNPTAIITSGWMDADYNAIAREWSNVTPVILTFDNWWHGDIKQRIASFLSPLFIKRRFNRLWVPGAPQLPYAKRLGFASDSIATGYYCADHKQFDLIHHKRSKSLAKKRKRLLFVGRYQGIKGLPQLWSAFMNLNHQHPEWELHCVGTGDLWETRSIHRDIIHHGFKQPHELADVITEADAFILPSTFEPWGVVLHEMAIAGLPILCSNRVGSATEFLVPLQNGFDFSPNEKSISRSLEKLYRLTEQELQSYGECSRNLGLKRTPSHWVNTLLQQL